MNAIIFGYLIFKISAKSDIDYIYQFISIVIIPIIILFLLWKYSGASLGKLIFKTRIVDIETGDHPTDKQLIYRLLGNFLSINSFLISFLHVGFDSRNQAWHDKIARTAVVKSSDITSLKIENSTLSKKRDKLFLQIEAGIFLLLFSGFLIFMFFMYYDEPLLPEAKEWMQKENYVDENPEDNGFYFLLGFGCTQENDPFETGYEWVMNQNKIVNKGYEPFEVFYDKNRDYSKRTEFKRKRQEDLDKCDFDRISTKIIADNFFFNSQTNDLDYYVQKKDLIDSLMVAYDFLLKRDDHLGSYSYFKNTILPHYKKLSPIVISIGVVTHLKLAWIGKEYKIGNKQKAIEELQNEMKKSRNLIHNSQLLIGKFVTMESFSYKLRLLSILIDESDNELLESIIPQPLTSTEKIWNQEVISIFLKMITPYFRYYDSNLIESKTNGRISRLIYEIRLRRKLKINKVINRIYRNCYNLRVLSGLNAKEFSEQKDKDWEIKPGKWDYIFNPSGSLPYSSHYPTFISDIYKYHDIDGYINMLKLKLMIKQQQLTSEQIPAFLESQKDSLFNPYTEEAIKWDAEKTILYFEGPYKDNYTVREIRL
jgi:hypothetical protein